MLSKTIYANLYSITHDERYLTRYIKFIESRKQLKLDYNETHHICPRSMFPELTKDKTNLILLSAREHFIAHYLLMKTYMNTSMIYGFITMKQKNGGQYRYINSRLYEVGRIIHSKDMKTKTGDKNSFYNKKHSQESKDKMSKSKKGRPNNSWNTGLTKDNSEKLKSVGANISKAVSGLRNWTDGNIDIKSEECPGKGWVIGRAPNENYKFTEEDKLRQSEVLSSGVCNWWNDGVKNKRQKDKPDGDDWVRGRLKSSMSKNFNGGKLKRFNKYTLLDLSLNELIILNYDEFKLFKSKNSIGVYNFKSRKRRHNLSIDYLLLNRE